MYDQNNLMTNLLETSNLKKLMCNQINLNGQYITNLKLKTSSVI